MTLRARLGVAALMVVGVLVAVGLLLPRTVRSSEIEQADLQLAASLPRSSPEGSPSFPVTLSVGNRPARSP